MSLTVCRRCGRHISELPSGLWLKRVNEKGVSAIMECRPSCAEPLPSQDDAVMAAIMGDDKQTDGL
jgi:hypothetical protein